MLRQLDRLYRQGATGFAFAWLFVGGAALAATVLPLLSLVPGHGRERAQAVIRLTFRWYLAMLRGLSLLRIRVEGRDRLERCRGRVIIANHPSLLDVVILMALVPNAQCIVKSALWSNRYLGGLVRRAGYIRNDLEPEALIAECRAALDRGANIIVFPEGTRSAPGFPPHFHRGFANIATRTGAPVQPVVITCSPPTLCKGEAWWAVPARRPVFRVTVSDCVSPEIYTTYRHRSLASRHLVARIEAYYAEQLAHA
ncbi:MAG: lysophospholipid acyltransferase family protein [Gemmatimonas sp.]